MIVLSAKLAFLIPHARSLKDKRMAARSLIDKTRHRFGVSVAEVGTQDVHQTLTIGVAVVSGDARQARKALDEVLRYMEENAGGDLVSIIKSEDGI